MDKQEEKSPWIRLDDDSKKMPVRKDFLILFSNGEIRRHYENYHPAVDATHWCEIPKLPKEN